MSTSEGFNANNGNMKIKKTDNCKHRKKRRKRYSILSRFMVMLWKIYQVLYKVHLFLLI